MTTDRLGQRGASALGGLSRAGLHRSPNPTVQASQTVPFTNVIANDEAHLAAGVFPDRSRDELARFSDEGSDPYEEDRR